jgi:SAM-dependent methyltransferase
MIPSNLLEPRAPHDEFSFEQLRRSYNFDNVSGRGLMLTRLVIEACEQRDGDAIRVLDIGSGEGIERRPGYQWAIREHVDEYWAVEPDPSVSPSEELFDGFRGTELEQAGLPAEYFDVAYSFMVMEHVADPSGFMRALNRCLKPGGVYLFATPNRRHYFGRSAALLHRVHLDEAVLKLTVGQSAEEYHYPLQYRFNTERRIRRIAGRTGFDDPEFAFVEVQGAALHYFPRPIRFVWHLLRAKRQLLRNPRSLMMMLCRLPKPATTRAGEPSA